MNVLSRETAPGANPPPGYGMFRISFHTDDAAVFYFQKKTTPGMA
jgi:hypothetical protein